MILSSKKLAPNFLLISLAVFLNTTLIAQQRLDRSPIKEIVLTGSGYELGLQHGTLLKNEITEIVTKWKANTNRQLGKEADKVVEDFLKYAKFDDAIKKWTPALYEEIQGIAKGSGQEMDYIMVLNLLDEFWVWQDDLRNHHCSVIGVPSQNGSGSWLAQNIDIESYTDGYQVLLRLKRTAQSPEQLIVTHPGLIALAGMNESGIGACMNSLMQLKASSMGLPVAFIVRRILASKNKEDVLKFIETVPHASGQNYMIGIKGEIYNFEASANKVVSIPSTDKNGAFYHTNHPMVNDDVKEWYGAFNPTIPNGINGKRSNSHVRLEAIQKWGRSTDLINDVIIKNALRSKDDPNNPVCRSATGGGFTFSSIIMTLSGKPFLLVTAGPPDLSEYKRFDF